jgi:hypothetical protein
MKDSRTCTFFAQEYAGEEKRMKNMKNAVQFENSYPFLRVGGGFVDRNMLANKLFDA